MRIQRGTWRAFVLDGDLAGDDFLDHERLRLFLFPLSELLLQPDFLLSPAANDFLLSVDL